MIELKKLMMDTGKIHNPQMEENTMDFILTPKKEGEFTQVSKERFTEFVKNYPNKLVYDATGICEPPLGSYNDFTGGHVWPESMVAKIKLYDGSEYHGFKQPEYFIRIK